MAKILYLVIPCYNEEEVLADTAGKLDKKMKELMAERPFGYGISLSKGERFAPKG